MTGASIIGCSRWNDPNAFYDQLNNPTEHVLKLRSGTRLETCGPTASLNCQSSVGVGVDFETPGGYAPQPEEVLTGWFNDSRNFLRMRNAWKGLDPGLVPGNEVAQWYPLGVYEVFGNRCDFVGALTPQQAVDHLRQGRAIQTCLRNPGHFIALVAFDQAKDEFILKDSWGSRWPRGDGFCQRMSVREWQINSRPVNLVYYPKEPLARGRS
jgi:hypothetical protein